MPEPLNETDWGKLQKRLEMCRERKVSFDISVATAERIFAHIEDLKTEAAAAKQAIPAMQGHIDQAACDRDAAFARAEALQRDLDQVRAEVRRRGPPSETEDLSDEAKLKAFARLRARFHPEEMT